MTYRLIYHYRGKSSTWQHLFTHLGPYKTSIFEHLESPPRCMQFTPGGPWERTEDSARSWIECFSPMLRWAVILDEAGRVVFDWRRRVK